MSDFTSNQTVWSIKITVFCNMMPCILVDRGGGVSTDFWMYSSSGHREGRTAVNRLINCWVPKETLNFLTSRITVNFMYLFA